MHITTLGNLVCIGDYWRSKGLLLADTNFYGFLFALDFCGLYTINLLYNILWCVCDPVECVFWVVYWKVFSVA